MARGENAPAGTTFATTPVTIAIRHARRSKQEKRNTRGNDPQRWKPSRVDCSSLASGPAMR
jgi:hypothetical protein